MKKFIVLYYDKMNEGVCVETIYANNFSDCETRFLCWAIDIKDMSFEIIQISTGS